MILTEMNLNDDEKISSVEEITKDYPMISNFLEFFKKKFVIIKNEKGIYKIHLFTDNYQYSIVVFEEWCGGYTTVRKRGIMESWERGNDLIDGKPSEQLFSKMALYMLKNELITLGDIEFKTSSEVFGVQEDQPNEKK